MNNYIYLSTILVVIGFTGMFINKKNIISLLMSLEIILLGINTNFVAFSNYWSDVNGQIFVFFILTVAAAEAAIGLALLVLLYRAKNTINVDDLNELKG
jgi:NADH-quinone oxidoreductase subunit K